ncbi:hypothetical protein C1M56_15305 [Vibrio diazotrophicus]|nr:hypothetical protein C1M56_15305 [Vibrio diazotrophicus]
MHDKYSYGNIIANHFAQQYGRFLILHHTVLAIIRAKSCLLTLSSGVFNKSPIMNELYKLDGLLSHIKGIVIKVAIILCSYWLRE